MTKTVMITGAGSGFGKGASLALAGRGHQVIATTETDAQAAELRAEAPQLTVEKLDITSADVAKAADWDIDVLINNAGAGQTGPMADVPLDRVRHLFEVNVFGTLAITQHVLAAHGRQGCRADHHRVVDRRRDVRSVVRSVLDDEARARGDGQGDARRAGAAGDRRHAAEPGPVPHRVQRPDGRLDVGVVRRATRSTRPRPRCSR